MNAVVMVMVIGGGALTLFVGIALDRVWPMGDPTDELPEGGLHSEWPERLTDLAPAALRPSDTPIYDDLVRLLSGPVTP